MTKRHYAVVAMLFSFAGAAGAGKYDSFGRARHPEGGKLNPGG